MNIAACLLLYSFAVVLLGSPLLGRLTRRGHAPRFGVAAWLTAIGSVLITWVAAVVLIGIDVAGHWDHRDAFIASCLARLRGAATGHAGVGTQVILLVVTAGVAAAAAVVGVRLTRALLGLRARAHEHAHAVRIVGRRTREPDVVVLDVAKPAAYCVSGRPPAIVVTTGALSTLDERQLAAVLAHERAHLAGHHPHVVAALRGLANVLPRLPLMTAAVTEVSRLLEMCADDAAARSHGRRELLSGLIALAGAAAPAEALAAADVAVLSRAERLIRPPGLPAQARAWVSLAGVLTVIATGPLITAALAASGVLICAT